MTTRPLLPVVVSALLLAGCGGSSGPSTTPVTSNRSTSATAHVTPTAPAPGGSAAGNTSGGAPAGSSGGGSTTGSGTSSTTGAATNNGGTSSTFTAPGTYHYDTSGTVTAGTPKDASGTATLTVDPPAGGQQHSLLGTDQGRTEQTVVVRTGGTFLVRLVITNPAFSKEFASTAGLLLVPEPTTVGRSWSWTATSTDGKTKASVTAKITGRATLTIGGVATPTTTIDRTLRLTGDVDYTGKTQYWYDEAHRLQAKDHTKGSGTFGGIPFTTDITTVLQSTKPD